MGDPAARSRALRAALLVSPDDAELRSLLVDALESAGSLDEAIAELKVLVAAAPDNAAYKMRLAHAYVATGKAGAARAVLDDLERTGAMPTDGWQLRGRLLSLGDQDGPDGPEPAVAEPPPTETDPRRATGKVMESTVTTFADVGGMASLKESIRLKIIYPAEHPELYRAYGKRRGGGLLLYGPPGCGKTHIARATAGEIGAAFMSVGIADVLEMWIGSSERNLSAIFASARAHRPCVLFFDEVDALGSDRAAFKSTAGRSVVNQFLAELDGVGGDNEGILVLGATNAPWHLDAAFRRPGRFDEVLFVPPPDGPARREILRVLLRDRPVADIDLDRLADRTAEYSGADLRGLVERALERKLAESLRSGKVEPLRTADLLAAAKGLPPTTREWFATVRNYVLYANKSGLYDAVREYLPPT